MAQLTKFGARCRELRSERRLRMIDQAQVLGCSTSFISAVELGEKKPPEAYAARFSEWLQLADEQAEALQALADSRSNVLHFRPKDPEQAAVARRLFRKISKMSPTEIRRIHLTLQRKPPDDGRRIR
jgi:transcriptional regulator with XRE-family HTH domain